MGPAKLFVDDGALASYGPDFPAQWHRAEPELQKDAIDLIHSPVPTVETFRLKKPLAAAWIVIVPCG
jgi:hypothetical protein